MMSWYVTNAEGCVETESELHGFDVVQVVDVGVPLQ